MTEGNQEVMRDVNVEFVYRKKMDKKRNMKGL